MNTKNKGFTIIETIVAILILLIATVALMVLVSRILLVTRSQRLDVTSQYLLQEAVEYLRNNRDSALNGGATWNDYSQVNFGSCPLVIGSGTTSPCPCVYPFGQPGSCTIDPVFNEIVACPSTGCPNIMKIENSGRTIFCTPGSNCPGSFTNLGLTSFNRSIRMEPNPVNPDELFVDITISWLDSGGSQKQKTINTSLLNW